MITSPASRSLPKASIGKQSNPCGGNLARPMSSRTGHFQLRGLGFISLPSPTSGCGDTQAAATAKSHPFSFLHPAHDLRADQSNRHQSLWLPCRAAGHSLRTSPRLHIVPQVDDFTHPGGSKLCSTSRKREHRRRSFHGFGKVCHDGAR